MNVTSISLKMLKMIPREWKRIRTKNFLENKFLFIVMQIVYIPFESLLMS